MVLCFALQLIGYKPHKISTIVDPGAVGYLFKRAISPIKFLLL